MYRINHGRDLPYCIEETNVMNTKVGSFFYLFILYHLTYAKVFFLSPHLYRLNISVKTFHQYYKAEHYTYLLLVTLSWKRNCITLTGSLLSLEIAVAIHHTARLACKVHNYFSFIVRIATMENRYCE
jgi:hypothetical protein